MNAKNCEECGHQAFKSPECDEWICPKCDDGYCLVCGEHYLGLGNKNEEK